MTVAVKGKVARVYATNGHTYFRLKDVNPAPKDGYFKLLMSHPNYNALYALGLAAAVNGHTLMIRTDDDITPSEHGIVNYMVVDY